MSGFARRPYLATFVIDELALHFRPGVRRVVAPGVGGSRIFLRLVQPAAMVSGRRERGAALDAQAPVRCHEPGHRLPDCGSSDESHSDPERMPSRIIGANLATPR